MQSLVRHRDMGRTLVPVKGRVQVFLGDITTSQVDAIVNAANESLLGGAGVDGAIHRAAGPRLLAECRTLGGCPTGEARLTGGYDLPAKHVIHTVGPVWRGGGHGEHTLLASCYRNCFAIAEEHGFRTIAFPAISAGAYAFPLDQAAAIAVTETVDFLGRNTSLDTVTLVCFSDRAYRLYLDTVRNIAVDSPLPNAGEG